MISTNRNTFFSRNREPNLFIENGASTFPTRESLANSLTAVNRDIRFFQIVGNNVYAKMRKEYSINSSTLSAFYNNPFITTIEDYAGLCKSVGQSGLSTSGESPMALTNIYLPKASYSTNALAYNTNLTNIKYNGEFHSEMPNIEGSALRGTSIKKINLPNAEIISGSIGLNNIVLEEVHAPKLKSLLGGTCFRQATALKTFDVSKIEEMNFYYTFYLASSLEYLYFDNLTTISTSGNSASQTFRLMTSLKEFKANKLESLPKVSLWQQCSSLELIEIKKVKNFGDPTLNNNTFTGIKLGCVIKVNIALATSNSGTPDIALQWVKDNRSAIVEFYDDSGNHVSTL